MPKVASEPKALSMNIWYMLTFTLIIMFNITNSTVINATNSNATHEYFIASDYTDQTNYFKNSSIICTTPICHVICDKEEACRESKIYANSQNATTLIVKCTDDFACNNAEIYASEVMNVNIVCKDERLFSGWNPTCQYLMVNASHSNNVYFRFNRAYCGEYSNLYVNNAGSVTIMTTNTQGTTSNNRALSGATLYGYNIRNLLNITCDSSVCNGFTVYANNMLSSSIFNMECYKLNACENTKIYCPTDTQCNINCGLSDACQDTEIHIGANNYTGLNLQCGRYACTDPILHCDTDAQPQYLFDSGLSELSYNYVKDEIRCDYPTARCCPDEMRYIQCDGGATCEIDCAVTNCARQIINATLATALIIDCAGETCSSTTNICTGSTCDGSTIYCPTGNNTSCIITCGPIGGGSCQYLDIQRDGNNIMNEFSLTCSQPSSGPIIREYNGYCYKVNVDLKATLIKSLSIDCVGEQSCRLMELNGLQNVASITDFSITCGQEACQDISLDLHVPLIQDLSIKCTGSYSCNYLSMLLSSMITNQFNLICSNYGCNDMNLTISSTTIPSLLLDCSDHGCGGHIGVLDITTITSVSIDTLFMKCDGCSGMKLVADNSIVKDLTMNCVQYGCSGINIDTQISNSALINCSIIDSCNSGMIKLVAATDIANFNIICRSPDYTDQGLYSNGACYQSRWDIYGYESNNNLTFECDGISGTKSEHDCEEIEIYGYNLNKASINCRDYRGCYLGVINMETVNTLDLNCLGEQSCSSTTIHCPYEHKNTCNIECDGYYDNQYDNMRASCASMDIMVSDIYSLDYLNLNCPSIENTQACGGFNVNCDDTLERALYVWDDNVQNWRCNNTLPKYCCPYFDKNIITCQSGQPCVVDCLNNTNCSEAIIDGTYATYLSLHCSNDQCENALVWCPINGCSIQCNGYKSCHGMYVIHMNGKYGNALTNNGVIDISCFEYRACYNVLIEANWVDKITLTCTSTYIDQNVCFTMLNAKYANQVIINANERYSSYYDTFNVQNAKSVTLTGRGYLAIYGSILKADDADSVILSFYGQGWGMNIWYTTRESQFYIPRDTVINCHGTGCYYLGKIYRYSTVANVSGLYIYIDPCDQCHDIKGCIHDFEIRCDGGYAVYNSQDYPMDLCNDNDCGCQDLFSRIDVLPVNNITKQIIRNEKCYSDTQSPTITSNPTISPITVSPSGTPTNTPTNNLTNKQTIQPTINPSTEPTTYPTTQPSSDPTNKPTLVVIIMNPTVSPTHILTSKLTDANLTSEQTKDSPSENNSQSKPSYTIIISVVCIMTVCIVNVFILLYILNLWQQKQTKIKINDFDYAELIDVPIDNKNDVTPSQHSLNADTGGKIIEMMQNVGVENDEADNIDRDHGHIIDTIKEGHDNIDTPNDRIDGNTLQNEQRIHKKSEYNVGNAGIIDTRKQTGNLTIIHYYQDFVDFEQDENIYNQELYHEKQKWEMCLMHALNGLLQKRIFTVKKMNNICKELAPNKLINPHKSMLKTGNYDANVLVMAL
eukprot:38621_1